MNTMEMPVPCQKCGEWFELHKGRGSRRWYPNTVICSDCGEEEQEEIERENEIRDLEDMISDAHVDIETCENEISHQQDLISELKNSIKGWRERIEELKKLQ